jgi:hypothetical protein
MVQQVLHQGVIERPQALQAEVMEVQRFIANFRIARQYGGQLVAGRHGRAQHGECAAWHGQRQAG